MSKNIVLIAIGLIVGLALGAFIASNEQKFSGLYSPDFQVDSLTVTTTSTTSLLPVKVLDYNGDRHYAEITNVSDTAIYLYPAYFTDPSAASTTVGVSGGIRLNTVGTVGSTYVIDQDNLYIGQLWASSTAASKDLYILENN